MMERRRIVELWKRGIAETLVTLVRAEGSSYRRPGARMLSGLGEYAGTVSGGCLESDVVKKARWLARNGAAVERYSTLFDDAEEVPFGLGCGGVVDLLVEPANTEECEALLGAMDRSLDGSEARVVTYLPGNGKGLRRVVFGTDSAVIFASAGLTRDCVECARGLAAGREYEGRFVEELRTPQRLFVLGAGEDAKPVVSMAALLGWTVVVGDGRAQTVRAERFPEAESVGVVTDVRELGLRRGDAVVVMTHSYELDGTMLTGLLGLTERPRYIGLLGSRHRSSLLVTEVAGRLGRSVEECCEGLFAPVGLDLGGDGPEAIALAVVAQVQALCEGRLGNSRTMSAEEMGRQVARGGSSRYLQMQCGLDVA